MPSRHALVCLVALTVTLLPGSLSAQSVAIDYKPVGCLVVGKYPRLSACLSPAAQVARARVYFKPEEAKIWYYVEMTRQVPCFDGILPKPTRKLIGKKVLYYMGASDRQFVESRTQDTAAEVVAREGECRKDLPVAPFVTNASVTVFPSVPAGFAAAGIGTGTAVALGAGAAAVAGGAIAVASKGGGNGPSTPPTLPSTPPSTPPDVPPTMPSTPPSTPPVTGENRPPLADFRVSPDPPEGASPLDVTFNMCRSTDPDGDELKFTFDYGDGTEFRGNCRTTHAYPYPPGPPSVVATICVGDGLRGHDSCRSYTVRVRNACANDTRPPFVSLDPPDGRKTPIVVSAQASDNVGVTAVEFFAGDSEGPLSSIGADRDAPYSIQWKPKPACASFRLVAKAHDACGNEDVSKPVFVTHSDPVVCGNPRPSSTSAGAVVLSSELRLTEGRGHVTVNGAGSIPAGPGRSRASVTASSGDNLVEALVVDGPDQPGTWRFELAGDAVPGSLRVEAGEVVEVMGDAIVFRVTGKAGERIAFRFRGKP